MAGRAADANALHVGRQLPDCFVHDFPVPPHDDTAVNLTNLTVPTFMLAILPQFVDPSSGPAGLQLLVFGATMKGTGLFGSVALASGAAGGWLSRHGRLLVWQERFAGAVMIAFGLRLLLAGKARPALR